MHLFFCDNGRTALDRFRLLFSYAEVTRRNMFQNFFSRNIRSVLRKRISSYETDLVLSLKKIWRILLVVIYKRNNYFDNNEWAGWSTVKGRRGISHYRISCISNCLSSMYFIYPCYRNKFKLIKKIVLL